MDCVCVVLVVLPHVGQSHVHSPTLVPGKEILAKDPVVEVVGVPQVLGVLDNSPAVVQELRPVDHVRDLRHIKLVEPRCGHYQIIFVSWEKHVIDSPLCDFTIVDPPDTWLCSVSEDRAG